ncbi:MAG: hypothetical protein L6R42_006077 [Xanthoria sp. 1 TBL-2021]|nr:MAG: hypothetical protein L6R42_006077 [Xanthoria sp. 1 TBL-2021]
MAFTMWTLASDHRLLISQLEFLGKGIDTRHFNTARQNRLANMTIINVSTVDADRAPAPSNLSADQASNHSASLQSIRPPPSANSPVKSPVTSNRPVDLESSPDPIVERTVRLETEARILQQQAYLEQEKQLLEEQQQKVRKIEEEIFHNQILLGPALPPAHLDVKNPFDEMSTYQVGDNQNSGSPRDMTLVEPEPEPKLEHQLPTTSSSKRPIPGLVDMASGNECPHSEDILMEELMHVQDIRSDAPTYTGDKKRKRFSFLPAAKKARTSEHALCLDMHADSHASTNRFGASGPTESIGKQATYLADADKPSITTRPTSWPRCRLFRRSAGVSVKKITEVFEKLRLQHDKALPAAL